MTGALADLIRLLLVAGLVAWPSALVLANGPGERTFSPQRAPEALRRTASEQPPSAATDLAWFLGTGGRQFVDLLAATGIDTKRLLKGLVRAPVEGVGGPFQALDDSLPLTEVEMAALVDRVRDTVPLASPVRDPHRLTSGFGKRSDPFRKRSAFHRGLDIAAPRGTPIYATAAGTVVRAGRADAYGNLVEIDHGNGVRTVYAHLHEYHVRRGERVAGGKLIGKMGRTGRATGVHLHYEVIVDDRPVNPRRFLEAGQILEAGTS